MTVVRRAARPLLSTVFVWGGTDSLRNPDTRVAAAQRVAPMLSARVPYLPEDPRQLIRINAAVQIVAGSLLALGRFPRLSASVLAGTLVPTTLAGHRFWEEDEPTKRAQQRIHFLKNMGLLGGLLLAAVDTEARPGVAWRARHATAHVAAGGRRTRRTARLGAASAAESARRRLPG